MTSMRKPITYETRTCSVHKLVDGDESPRSCRKCSACGEWMCDECWSDGPKRAQAAAIKAKNRAAVVLKEGVKMVRKLGQRNPKKQ